ncbi:hypothetical protein LTR85_001464 [Meristemomyces frigidus]|nr:hypothetical protein LTR85_001464 [Meristemomyces frigidus]
MLADRYFNGSEIRRTMPADRELFHQCLSTLRSEETNGNVLLENMMDPVMVSHSIAVVNRKLFASRGGYMGVCPEAVVAGDQLYVLSGCPAPVVLRQRIDWDEGRCHRALGHCYVHGLMDGEAADLGLPTERVHVN